MNEEHNQQEIPFYAFLIMLATSIVASQSKSDVRNASISDFLNI